MSILNADSINQIIAEVTGDAEFNRKAEALKRHTIYKDGGKQFLLEAVEREFNREAVKEMRLAPINVLKKVVDKRSGVYKKGPARETELESDQALVDHYVKAMGLNVVMQWCNRFYSLFANTALYVMPTDDGLIVRNVPPYLFSLLASPKDPEKILGYVLSAFDNSRAAPVQSLSAPTGIQRFTNNQATLLSDADKVGSNELRMTEGQELIVWTNYEHVTVNDHGEIQRDPNRDAEQFTNPLGKAPFVFVSKSRHNQTWSTVGSDQADIALLIQLAWSDLLTIAKHQGYSLLTFTGKEPPQKLTMGINRAIFLKQDDSGVAPTVDYITANSPLSEYKEILVELLAMFLSTNDMNPNSVGGTASANSATSGFHALIQSADTLEAIEADKPTMKHAEHELWEVISKYHNYLYDINDPRLGDEARKLGKFSEGFQIQIGYSDAKPLESEQEVIENVIKLKGEGLISKRQSLKKLNPDMSDDQVMALMAEIEKERFDMAKAMNDRFVNQEVENPETEA
jgi:hypothetical protein